MKNWPAKDPNAVLDFVYDIPLDEGDSVVSYDLALTEGDVVIDSESRDGARVTVWLSGGTVGTANLFAISWVTAAGREDDDTISLAIRDDTAADGYVDATAADLKAAYPRFADVTDSVVEFWLERARRSVDTSWTQDDYAMGQMLLAAHLMTLEGIGSGTEAELNAQGMGDFDSVRSGSFSFTRGKNSSGAASGTLKSTGYGRQFYALARANRGGARATSGGVIPDSSLYADRYIASGGR